MSDNKELYEPDLISVTDDDGNEITAQATSDQPINFLPLPCTAILPPGTCRNR